MGVSSIISRSYDLNKPLVKETLDHLLAMGDDQGDQFNIAVTNGSEPKDLLTGSVLGYFIKLESGKKIADCETVTIFGSSHDNIATVVLPESCYVKPCRFILTVKVSLDDTRHAVYIAEGAIQQTSTDHLIDPGHNIPDIEELLALIAQIEGAADRADEATERADSAAKSANSAAKAANDAASDATNAASSANSAASDANAAKESATEAADKATTAASDVGEAVEDARAAASEARSAANDASYNADVALHAADNAEWATQRADNAAFYIKNLTVDSSQVPNNQGVDVVSSEVGNHLHLHFDIPEGPQGPKGDTGSIENFSITLKGDVSGHADGSSGDIVMDTKLEADVVRSVSGIKPDGMGNVDLVIGGRNYALNTSEEWSEWISPNLYNASNQTVHSIQVLLPDGLTQDDPITISMELETQGVTATENGSFLFRAQSRSGNVYDLLMNLRLLLNMTKPPEDGVRKLQLVTRADESLLNMERRYFNIGFRMDYWSAGRFRYRLVKVELGNAPTDWSPNPEDIEEQIQNAGKVKTVAGIGPDENGDVPIEVGGRNYLLNSGEAISNEGSGRIAIGFYTIPKGKLPEAPRYRLSFLVTVENAPQDSLIEAGFRNNSGTVLARLYAGPGGNLPTPTRLSGELILSEGFTASDVNRVSFYLTNGGSGRIIDAKLEIGDVSTDWTPAPEDGIGNTGVTAGTYGPSSNTTVGYGDKIKVPNLNILSDGRVKSANTYDVTLPPLPTAGQIGAIPITGPLKVDKTFFPVILVEPSYDGAICLSVYDGEDRSENNRRTLKVYGPNSKPEYGDDEAIVLETFKNSVGNGQKRIYYSDMKTPIPPQDGGTGVHSLQELREALGIPKGAKVLVGKTKLTFAATSSNNVGTVVTQTKTFTEVDGADSYEILYWIGYAGMPSKCDLDSDGRSITTEFRNIQGNGVTPWVEFVIGGYKTL